MPDNDFENRAGRAFYLIPILCIIFLPFRFLVFQDFSWSKMFTAITFYIVMFTLLFLGRRRIGKNIARNNDGINLYVTAVLMALFMTFFVRGD
jgi:hypothetical protein